MKLADDPSKHLDFEYIITQGSGGVSRINTTLLLPGTYLEHPIRDKKTLKNCLTQYFFSLSVLQDALIQFLDHHYRKFDALIGNNSCYASAYTIFRIAFRIANDQEFKDQLSLGLKRLEKARKKALHELKDLESDFPSGHVKDFRQFLFNKDLVLDLPIELVYLGIAFGCGISKEKNDQNIEEIQYEILLLQYEKLKVHLTKKSTVKLIKHWQKVLAILNVKTLQDHAKFSNAQPWVKYLFGEYVLIDERNRPCLASFYASKIIYDLLLSMPQALIGLQVNIVHKPEQYLNRFTVLYEVQPDRTLRVLDPEELSYTRPIYMLVGCRYISEQCIDIPTLKAEFNQRSLEDIIFAHEVTYPQYPKALEATNISPQEPELVQEIERLKKLEGFSLEDPSDLCLVHIFVDDTQSQALSAYDPPVYLPKLGEKKSDDEPCYKTHDS
jgi:hypothetical protein